MRDIIQCMNVLYKLPNNQSDAVAGGVADAAKQEVKGSCSTQTEIVAVHTPQVENLPLFPFKMARPSTLSLSDTNDSSSSARNANESADAEISAKSENKSDSAEPSEH